MRRRCALARIDTSTSSTRDLAPIAVEARAHVQVQRFFGTKHNGKFLIFNLCQVPPLCAAERLVSHPRRVRTCAASSAPASHASAYCASNAPRGAGGKERDYDKQLFDGRVERIPVTAPPAAGHDPLRTRSHAGHAFGAGRAHRGPVTALPPRPP